MMDKKELHDYQHFIIEIQQLVGVLVTLLCNGLRYVKMYPGQGEG